jgi:hypothetical protein
MVPVVPVLQFGVPGGPELLILFLIYAVVGLVPIVAAVAFVYLVYKIRQDTRRMADALERIEERV